MLAAPGISSDGNLPDDPLGLSMDIGVDSHDFRQRRFDEIQVVMKTKADAKTKPAPASTDLPEIGASL
jgi:hypothetical protein